MIISNKEYLKKKFFPNSSNGIENFNSNISSNISSVFLKSFSKLDELIQFQYFGYSSFSDNSVTIKMSQNQNRKTETENNDQSNTIETDGGDQSNTIEIKNKDQSNTFETESSQSNTCLTLRLESQSVFTEIDNINGQAHIFKKSLNSDNVENVQTLFGNNTNQFSSNETSLTTSLSSSSSNNDVSEQKTLNDLRCTKFIEQGIKLGYSAESVMQVLKSLGTECSFNDVFSQLITLGMSDSSIEIPQVDRELQSDTLKLKKTETQRVSPEPENSLPFNKREDLHEKSQDSVHQAVSESDVSDNLRDVIIDGSNVAMSHGKIINNGDVTNDERPVFSCKGIQIVVDWFQARGHKTITAFVPRWRKDIPDTDNPITDQDILFKLERQRIVVFTPSRRVNGRRVVCYDDRYILNLALETSAIIVSNDVYRDLVNDNEKFRTIVDQRLLMYSFVNDRFMPPDDPLGRLGPTLDDFLLKTSPQPIVKPPDCPYGKKCTYGNKCRFYHPKWGYISQKSVFESIKEQPQEKPNKRASKMAEIFDIGRRAKQRLCRTKSLNPSETMPIVVSSVETKNKQVRPKFSHSKSVQTPTKSADYLNEPRRKLEEAEQAAALEELQKKCPSIDRSVADILLTDVCFSDNFKNIKSKFAGLQMSDLLENDVLKANSLASNNNFKNTCTDQQFKKSSQFKSKDMRTSPSSTSVLPLSEAETHSGYLSGHLYLAKKLSDESSDGSFFSEHTCSNSAKPQLSGNSWGAGVEKSQTSNEENPFSKNPHNHIAGYIENTSEINNCSQPLSAYVANNSGHIESILASNNSLEHQQPALSGSLTDQYPGVMSIPNLSVDQYSGIMNATNVSESGTFRKCQQLESGTMSPPNRSEHTKTRKIADFPHTNLDNFTSPKDFIIPNFKSIPQQTGWDKLEPLKSYPLSKVEESSIFQRHQNLHRTYSSIDNVRATKDTSQMFDRRLSNFNSVQFGDDHSLLMTQFNTQNHFPGSQWHSGHPTGLRRQNSNSDPQLHNFSSYESVNTVLISNFNSRYPTYNFQEMYSAHPSQFINQFKYSQNQDPNMIQQQSQFCNLNTFQKHEPNQDAYAMYLIPSPVSNTWGQTSNNAHQDFTHAPGSIPYHLFQPVQTTIQNPNSFSNALTNTSAQANTNPYNYNIQYPSNYSQIPTMQTPMLLSSISPQHPTSIHESNPLFIHPPQNTFPANTIQQPFQPTARSFVVDEDASIKTNNPSYSVYFHLSNLFGEPLVQKILNRHPGITNPDQLCKLIIEYKEGRAN